MRRIISLGKIVILLFASSAILFIKSWLVLLAITILICASIIFYPRKKFLLRQLIPLIFLTLFAIIIGCFRLSFVAIAILFLKISSLSMLMFLFAATTSLGELISIFNFLPPNYRLVLVVAFGILPIIAKEAWQIKISQTASGLNVRPWNLPKKIFPLIIPLLHRSFLRAERISYLCRFE